MQVFSLKHLLHAFKLIIDFCKKEKRKFNKKKIVYVTMLISDLKKLFIIRIAVFIVIYFIVFIFFFLFARRLFFTYFI